MLSNIIAFLLFSLSLAQQNEPVFVYSNEILQDSKDCTVHQGDSLTLVACPTFYALYHSNDLAIRAKSIANYGETRAASAIGNSLAPNRDGHLTYLIDGVQVTSAWWDSKHNKAVKTTLATLDLEGGIASDLYVFEDLIAIRMQDSGLKFFQMPLEHGSSAKEI